MVATNMPELESATFCLSLSVEPKCILDWRCCIGLRGFLGYRLESLIRPVKQWLIPDFHGNHNNPAHFRLQLEESNSETGLHIVRVITFGPRSAAMIEAFAQVLKHTCGELKTSSGCIPFEVLETTDPEYGAILLPLPEANGEQLFPEVAQLSSLAPCFLKKDTPEVFSSGYWTQLLALRYADLAEQRRQKVSGRFAPIPGTVHHMRRKAYSLSMGGRPRPRTGLEYSADFIVSEVWHFRMLELLCLIGLGKHCAYGAGAFSMRQIEDQPAHKNL